METWALIYNPRAGGFRQGTLEAIARALRDAGVQTRLLPTGRPGHATLLASEAGGVATVAVYGGDGTLNEAANGLLGGRTALAFLPGGTANVMALELGLPNNPVKAATMLARGGVRPVYPGILHGTVHGAVQGAPQGSPHDSSQDRCFLLMAGFGFDADAVAAVNSRLKARVGKAAYAISALQVMGRAQPGMRVTGAGDREAISTDWAVVCRSRHYAGRYVLHSGAGLEAPALGLAAVPPRRVLPFLIGRMGLRLPFSGYFSSLGAEGCAIEADAPVGVQVDGEFVGRASSFKVGLAAKPLLMRFPG